MEEKLSLEELKKKLQDCQKKSEEYLAGWQRSRADFLNYKKEEMERIGEFLKYATEEFILKILPILDNFDIAEKNLSEKLKNEENVKGILQIKTQLQDFLKSQGLEEIKTVGQNFDPNLHEVVGEVPASAEASAGKSGIIIEEVQKGYLLNGRVVRPAKVRVTK